MAADGLAQGPTGDVYPQPNTTTVTVTAQGGGTVTVPGTPGVTVTTPGETTTVGDGGGSGGGGTPIGDEEGGGNGGGNQGTNSGSGGASRPVVVRGGGAGTGAGNYAIIHLGSDPQDPDVSDDLEDRILQALGAPKFKATLADIDVDALSAALKGTEFSGLGSGDVDEDLLRKLAARLGEEIVTPDGILPDVRSILFDDFEGTLGPLSGVVFTRVDRSEEDGDEAKFATILENGLIRGVRESDVPADNGGEIAVPAVGVEETDTEPSEIEFYKDRKISSVDNVDQPVGRATLAVIMQGATGHYGVKDTADAPFPQAYSGPQPVRFRTAGALVDAAEAKDPVSSGTIALIVVIALAGGWSVGTAGRRVVRKRISA